MERVPRSENSEESDRNRDRSSHRKKRRFDSGPDPNKIKELLTKRDRDYDKTPDSPTDQQNQSNAAGLKKPPMFVGCDKHAKRAYIGNIPADTDAIDLQCFLNLSMNAAGGCLEDGNPVLNSSFINLDKRFMFVELRSVEETTAIMQLDGIKYRNHTLKIRRPVDYDRNPVIEPERAIPKLNLSKLGMISTQVEDSELKLFVGGLPQSMNEEQIK